jgi:hypothetical protein
MGLFWVEILLEFFIQISIIAFDKTHIELRVFPVIFHFDEIL